MTTILDVKSESELFNPLPFFATVMYQVTGAKMPIACTFRLNGEPMSILRCAGVGDFAAFSGDGTGKDDPKAAAIRDVGPLPPGRYYIVDRGSGGLFSHLVDFFRTHVYGTDRSKWFALYHANTSDDWVFVNGVKRGNFRLHPHGPRNLGQGCITLADPVAFEKLRRSLKSTTQIAIPVGKGFAYGTVDVK
ncbi:DUF2778 domain-containing protein [Paraburkholderia azotifigens]|uniref:DUF2778 domain-containing protein n=2 Tax=Paraburkholderia azotifigens TaxID=2057004 RepID=A0ABU9QUV6_9BURK|nr:DUF2778 domain-containing protein [Paraburkholderia azotifigens]